jgi:hypothetical protein
VLTIENTPGALAKVTAVLAEAQLNLFGVTLGRHGDGGNLRFTVDDSGKAVKVLKAAGYDAKALPVASLRVENTPGALGKVAAVLAERGINIESVFLSARGTREVELIVQVDDLEGARRALGRHVRE